MATIYFTNNADSGDGSLRDALAAASPSDVVTYADGYFDGSDEIVISLSSRVAITKDVVLDARDKRIVLDGQFTSRCLWVSADLQLRKFDLINGYSDSSYSSGVYVSQGGSVTLDACRIYGCFCKFYGSALYAFSGSVVLNDCLIAGCCTETAQDRSASVRVEGGSSVAINRCTIVGDTQRALSAGTDVPIEVADSLVQGVYNVSSAVSVTPSTCGFVAPCPDTIDPESWTNTLWQSWDFRLTPESPYLVGAETVEAGDADLLGNPRQVGGALGAFEGSWLVVGASGAETVASDAAVDWLEVASTGVLTLSGADRILTVSRGVFVETGAAITSSSRGYVVAPSASDCDAATLTNVVCCVSGAGASDFHAQITSPTTASLSWSQTDSDVPVLLEAREPESNTWTTLSTSATSPYTVTDDDIVYLTFRIFDGENFYTAAGSYTFAKFYQVVAGYVPRNNDTTPHSWQTVIKLLTVNEMNENLKPGQDCAILARVYDAFDNDSPLLNLGSNISSVYYTCEKKTKSLYTTEWSPVTGHNNVSAGADCVLSSLQTDDAWDLDNVGYNFLLSPEIRDYPLFETAGLYRIKATINPAGGDPITFYKEINVVE